jgi:hypothetical protein
VETLEGGEGVLEELNKIERLVIFDKIKSQINPEVEVSAR